MKKIKKSQYKNEEQLVVKNTIYGCVKGEVVIVSNCLKRKIRHRGWVIEIIKANQVKIEMSTKYLRKLK